MKKRDTDLSLHYQQAFDYWTKLVPNRPQYVILCNFNVYCKTTQSHDSDCKTCYINRDNFIKWSDGR